MLVELQVRNYGLIEDMSAEFSPGLNVLSGETGVGKSLIISAVKFLMGSRANAEILRDGAKAASVTGRFVLPADYVRTLRKELGDSYELLDEELVLKRSFVPGTRNRCSVNGELTSVSGLAEVARRLIDIHGQHEEQSLLKPSQQQLLLDRYGRCIGAREKFGELFQLWKETFRRKRELAESAEARKRELDLLRFQAKEIEDVALVPGEYDELKREQAMFENLQQIIEASSRAQEEVYEGDGSILGRLEAVRKSLAPFAELDSSIGEIVESIGGAQSLLSDLSTFLSRFTGKVEYDLERKTEVESRLDHLGDLRIKYGRDDATILHFLETTKQRIVELQQADEDTARYDSDLDKWAHQLVGMGEKLHKKRARAARKLSAEIVEALKALGIQQAAFRIDVRKLSCLSDAAESGLDTVQYLFSANAGEDLKSLAEVASGGEVSRIFLAVKKILSREDAVPTLVFDEIDANIGGRLGAVVGEMLAGLASHHQLICVTHLPQIASFAEHHIKITKRKARGRTETVVTSLDERSRQAEIAEMIRGEGATSVTLREAGDMLSDAAIRKVTAQQAVART